MEPELTDYNGAEAAVEDPQKHRKFLGCLSLTRG